MESIKLYFTKVGKIKEVIRNQNEKSMAKIERDIMK